MTRLAISILIGLGLTAPTMADEQIDLAVALSNLSASTVVEQEAPEAAGAFDAGSWVGYAIASARFADDDADLYDGRVAFGYYFLDNVAINAELTGGYAKVYDDSRQDAGFGDLEVLFRWHFAGEPGWSLYFDGGAGIMQSTLSIPDEGTHFNFVLSAGLGATIDLNDRLKLMGGARYVHMSNARMRGSNRNPGWDGMMLYLGLMLTF
ncbi:MAG: hypothetical protein CMJ18_11535 [Phycisphaeraceae bacterium]|nr:hypothetical protein [Phycisphaeraceae bacterium]